VHAVGDAVVGILVGLADFNAAAGVRRGEEAESN